jgi:hypothetical protein
MERVIQTTKKGLTVPDRMRFSQARGRNFSQNKEPLGSNITVLSANRTSSSDEA